MPVRTARIEITKPNNDKELLAIAVDIQRIKNRLWQIWLIWHVLNGSAEKLREHLRANATTKAKRSPMPVQCLPIELTETSRETSFYQTIAREFPAIHGQTRQIVYQEWASLLLHRKAAHGSLPGWMAILFSNEAIPSYTRPQPIPFDRRNAKLIGPTSESRLTAIEWRIQREPETGESVIDRSTFWLNKTKARTYRMILDRILSGDYRWKGASLVYDQGKWFANLGYELPVKVTPQLDDQKVLVIRAGRKTPWRICVIEHGRIHPSNRFGGNGIQIVNARRMVQSERASRMEHYRWAGSNAKGHGRKRAISIWTKLSSRWKHLVKQFNNEVTKQLLNTAKRLGCGRIVFIEPNARNRDSRFLANSENGMEWEFFQFGSMLAAKCESEGIKFDRATTEKAKAKNGSKTTADCV